MPIVVGVTLAGPGWLFTLMVAAVAGLAYDEYRIVTGGGPRGRWTVLVALMVTASFFFGGERALLALSFGLLALMAALLADAATADTAIDVRERMTREASGLLYTAVLPGFVLLLPREPVLVLLAIVWVGDMGAYCGGRTLGRHALAPRISPKKTIEGAVAGLVSSVAAGIGAALAFGIAPSVRLVAIGVLVAAAAQVGDLAESALKRGAGVKDSSSLLPGHGGMLDRIDGLLFAAPVFYFLWGP
jgi:phosphatidate cytidylyltransferase